MSIKLKNDHTTFLKDCALITKNDPDYQYVIELKRLEDMTENEKFSIFSDTMFKTMFFNENKKNTVVNYFLIS